MITPHPRYMRNYGLKALLCMRIAFPYITLARIIACTQCPLHGQSQLELTATLATHWYMRNFLVSECMRENKYRYVFLVHALIYHKLSQSCTSVMHSIFFSRRVLFQSVTGLRVPVYIANHIHRPSLLNIL